MEQKRLEPDVEVFLVQEYHERDRLLTLDGNEPRKSNDTIEKIYNNIREHWCAGNNASQLTKNKFL